MWVQTVEQCIGLLQQPWDEVHLDHDLDVDVRDDGVGLPEGWRPGVGIASMRERVAELGGRLAIEPCLPHGTRIIARLPAQEQL
jgi:signal transduction histidine kinase